MLLQDMVYECDATALASERALADAGKVREAVEAPAQVLGHYAAVLHLTVAHDGLEDELSMLQHPFVLVLRDALEEFRQREHGA